MYLARPTPTAVFITIPGVTGVGTAALAGLVATASQWPDSVIVPFAALTGLWVLGNWAGVAMYCHSLEVTAKLATNAKALEYLPRPAVEQEDDEPEPDYSDEGPGFHGLQRDKRTGKLLPGYAQDNRVYVPDDDGMGAQIYNLQVSRPVLDKLYRVVTAPHKDCKIPITNADFAKGSRPLFTAPAFKDFQRDLLAEHVAVEGRGNRVYLTERGRRVVIQKWEQVNQPPTSRRWGVFRG